MADNENTVTLADLITLTHEQKPLEFQDAFASLMGDRIAQAVDDRKVEIAQSLFVEPEPTGEQDDDLPSGDDNDDTEEEQEEQHDGEVA